MDLDQIRDDRIGDAAVKVSRTIVLGIGNILLSDDGAGVHVANSLARQLVESGTDRDVIVLDGGTIGLSLLSEIDANAGFIAVDAMELHASPGTVRVFEDSEMDRQLRGKKNSAHEVALSDLMMAAQLAGICPRHRALVAIQPETTVWGLSPTPAVADALPGAVLSVLSLIGKWHDG